MTTRHGVDSPLRLTPFKVGVVNQIGHILLAVSRLVGGKEHRFIAISMEVVIIAQIVAIQVIVGVILQTLERQLQQTVGIASQRHVQGSLLNNIPSVVVITFVQHDDSPFVVGIATIVMNKSGDIEIRVRHTGIHTTVFHVKAKQQLGGFRTQDVDNTAGSNNSPIIALLLQTYFIGSATGGNIAQVNIHRLASLGLNVETTHTTAINNEVHSLIKVPAVVGNGGAKGHRAAQGGLLYGADNSAAEVESAKTAGIGYVVLDGEPYGIFKITTAYQPFVCVDGSAESFDGVGAIGQGGWQSQRDTIPCIIIIGQVSFREQFNSFYLLVLIIIDAAANVEGAGRSGEVRHTDIDG